MSDIRILAVAAGRGGTGKSTIAFGLADALRAAHPDIDVALVDLDPQAGVTGYAKHAPSPDPVRDEPVSVHGLTLYRGGRALAHATEPDVKAHLERALAASPARVIVADMSPALTDVAHRVVFGRDDVMLIGAIKTEPGSFQSVNELVAYVSRRNLPYMLVPTIHRNVLLNNTMLLTLRQQHEGHVADTVVPLDGKAAECVVTGQPVTAYARRAKASRAIAQLVAEVFGEQPAAATPAATPAAEVSTDARPATPRRRPAGQRSSAPSAEATQRGRRPVEPAPPAAPAAPPRPRAAGKARSRAGAVHTED